MFGKLLKKAFAKSKDSGASLNELNDRLQFLEFDIEDKRAELARERDESRAETLRADLATLEDARDKLRDLRESLFRAKVDAARADLSLRATCQAADAIDAARDKLEEVELDGRAIERALANDSASPAEFAPTEEEMWRELERGIEDWRSL